MVLDQDPSQKSYHGCWWILAPEFNEIARWVMPCTSAEHVPIKMQVRTSVSLPLSAWFVYTQVAITLCFCAMAVGTAIVVYIWIQTGNMQLDKRPSYRKENIKLLQTPVIMTVVTGLLAFTSALLH